MCRLLIEMARRNSVMIRAGIKASKFLVCFVINTPISDPIATAYTMYTYIDSMHASRGFEVQKLGERGRRKLVIITEINLS